MVSHPMLSFFNRQGLYRFYYTSILIGLWISGILCSEPAALGSSVVDVKTVSVKVGDTLQLTCSTPDSGTFRVFWKKGEHILSVDSSIIVNEPRMKLVNGFDLEINDIVLEDEQQYECQVAATPMIQQFHNVIVTVPPNVEMTMEPGPHSLMLGEFFEVTCTATGKPKPSLTWKKSGKTYPSDQMPDTTLQIQSLSYEDGGQYECIADNGVGAPAVGTVNIEVHYEPKAEIADDMIHTAPGRSLSVVCSVLSSPDAEVTWSYDGMPIEDFPDRISKLVTEHFPKTLHELRFNPVTVDDLGQYECSAKNKYGEDSDSFNITALPRKVIISSEEISSYSEAYRIRWEVKSVPQLVSNKIKFRLISGVEPSTWQEINIPVNPAEKRDGSPDYYALTHDILSLTPDSFYDVMIQAENEFGFGESSDTFTFQTPLSGNDTLPAPPPPTTPPSTTNKPVVTDEPSTKQYVPYVMEENGSGHVEQHRFLLLLSLLLCSVIWSIL